MHFLAGRPDVAEPDFAPALALAERLGELSQGTRILIGFDMPVITASALTPIIEVDEEEPATPEGAEEEGPPPQPDLPGLVDPVAETVAALRRKGFGRLYVDGQTVSLVLDAKRSSLAMRSRLAKSSPRPSLSTAPNSA